MLAELEAEIEQQAPLEARQPKDVSRPSNEKLEDWSRRLRWLRQDDSDPSLWGRLAGRLRYWSQGAPLEVRQLLDPAFRPGRGSWATLVRSADELAKDEADLSNLLAATPLPDASDQRIVEWIAAALPLGAFNHALLLEAAAPLRERIRRWTSSCSLPRIAAVEGGSRRSSTHSASTAKPTYKQARTSPVRLQGMGTFRSPTQTPIPLLPFSRRPGGVGSSS